MKRLLVLIPVDVESLRVVCFEEDRVVLDRVHISSPDQFLDGVSDFLETLAWPILSIDQGAVVFGTSSASAVRVATTLLNTWGSVTNRPTYGIEAVHNLPASEIAARVHAAPPTSPVIPIYSRPPNLTHPSP